MKHAFAARWALCGAAVLAWPTVMQASSAHPLQLAQAHGEHGHQMHEQGHQTHQPGHQMHEQSHQAHGHHAAPAPSQEAIAAMPVASAVTISDCWIRLLPLPAPSAGYFHAQNGGDGSVTLTAAAAASYGQVMLHQTTHSDGMSRMSAVKGVEIPAGKTLEFKPGSYHIMLEKPVGGIKVGDTVPMQFLFESGEKAEAQCEVKPANTLAK